MPQKKLYRSRENAMIGGVCAGLGEYFDIDASLVRLAMVILIFPGGLSIWAYIIAWIIIPQKPLGSGDLPDSLPADSSSTLAEGEVSARVAETPDKSKSIVGIILIALGILFLLSTFNVFVWFSFYKLWPIILIIVGLVILVKGFNRGGANEG